MMSRKRITAKKIEAADKSFGQSSNDYLRSIAKEAIKGALDEVTKTLWTEAQQIANKEAEIIGVEPADYDVNEMYTPSEVPAEAEEANAEAEEVTEEVAEEETEAEAEVEEEIESEEDKEEDVKMAMIFEPRKTASKVFEPKKTAGAPIDAELIGKENWSQVQEKFPQYSKQQSLTMLAVAPTRRNTEAVSAVTETLDFVAGKLEEAGDAESATQLDVISELLTASVQECKKIASEK
jgi:hypothetical protein